MLPRLIARVIAASSLALPAAAQVYDYPGQSPNIVGPVVDFDAPGVVPGPVLPGVYAGSGVTSVLPVGAGWGANGTETYLGGWGQVLASVGGAPRIVGALAQIDVSAPGEGWEIALDAPVDELQVRFSTTSWFHHDVELFLGTTSLGVGSFGSSYALDLRYFRAAQGPFDRARITSFFGRAFGFDLLGVGHGPPPPPPGNDACATPRVVGQGPHAFTTRSATGSSEPWTCAGAGAPDVWFQYDAVTSGFDLEFRIEQADYIPRCELYTGACGTLNQIACSSAGLDVPGVVAGTRYLLRVGGWLGARGAGILRIAERNPTPPAAPGCVQTYFIANGGTADGGVVFFDLDVTDGVVIPGLELNTSSTAPVGLEVYVVPGTYAGNTANPGGAGWTRVATDDGLAVGLGQDQPTPVDFSAPWALPAGSWGVALVGRNAQTGATLRHAFATGTPFNQRHASGDGRIELEAGAAADVPWSANLTPSAVWNGRFCFSLPTLGTSYCTAVANGTGVPGRIRALGSLAVAQNDLTLRADDIPMNVFGFFLTSRTQGFVANPGGSQGNLCLGGAIGRFVGPGQIQHSGPSGSISLLLDVSRFPTPTGLVPAGVGEAWNFTLWFRDLGGIATSNFTDGVGVVFE